ncbi:MAG: ABC transporter ATP-binding protein [Terrimicrobiaceae bacterium]|nr:ABC transporter ATP-binding protein [Terrimicrobiaceae bacterium]
MSEVVIRVENLSKKYRLGVINRRMLVDQIESWVCRKLGRPDPHASVFEKATDRMPTAYDFWALHDVSFEVRRGDIVGVMGRNGSGKSTLLKLLSRITAPTGGRAFIRGRVASLLEVGTGFNYELTGKENVYLNGSILGLKAKEIDDRYDRIVEFAEIPDFMDTPVKRYSSGMRVRLAFAVAAHLEPEILILDEVLAVGDAKFQEKCLNRIDEIRNSGVTVLFVSHSPQSVMSLCTRGIVLRDGRLVGDGTAKEASEAYMESLHLTRRDSSLAGFPDPRVGIQAGTVAQFLAEHLRDGRIVFNIPVETSEGIRVVDVGWISNTRLQTLRTEPAWSAAPDVSVSIVSMARSPQQAENDNHYLLRAGASEAWIVAADGDVIRHKENHKKFLLQSGLERVF